MLLHEIISLGPSLGSVLEFHKYPEHFLVGLMEYFHVRRPNASPGVGVYVLVLGDVHVQSPGAGHDVILLLLLLGQAEAGQGGQQRAWLQRRGDSVAVGSDYLDGDMNLTEVHTSYLTNKCGHY